MHCIRKGLLYTLCTTFCGSEGKYYGGGASVHALPCQVVWQRFWFLGTDTGNRRMGDGFTVAQTQKGSSREKPQIAPVAHCHRKLSASISSVLLKNEMRAT